MFILNPYRYSAPANPLLDTYSGAAAAYSLRKLRIAYSGSAIRVRRSSDNTEQDIGLDGNGNLDESALTTFVGSNSGYVTKWYDQSGNARDAAQTTSANQPRIVNAGTVDKLNSKPTIVFDGSNDYLSLPTISSSGSNYSFISILENKSSANTTFYLFDSSATRIILALRYDGYISFYDTQWKKSSYTLGLEKIILTYTLGSNCNIYKNGTNILSTTYSQEKIDGLTTLGTVYDIGGNFINATLSEFIIYPSDQSSNRTGIESNINSYYSIY